MCASVAGKYRSRILSSPQGQRPPFRPADRLRETLFNGSRSNVAGSRFLVSSLALALSASKQSAVAQRKWSSIENHAAAAR